MSVGLNGESKICGITNLKDARQALESGASFIGFNFYKLSPRYISPSAARRILQRLPKNIKSVGVFVNESEVRMLAVARRIGLDYLQLHGEESPATVARLKRTLPVIKANSAYAIRFPRVSSVPTNTQPHFCSMDSIAVAMAEAARRFDGTSRVEPRAPAADS